MDALDPRGGLSEAYRQAVADVIPRGVDVPDEFWDALHDAIIAFDGFKKRRIANPPTRERNRYRRMEKLIDNLARELRDVNRRISWRHRDPLWAKRGLAALWDVKRNVEANRIGYEMLSTAFHGRGNPHRDFLYGKVCDLWVSYTKRPLRFSRSPMGVPGGPLVRFFAACVGPILGADAPGGHAIATILNREREKRKPYSVLNSKK
jgi:hypothetical protein